MLKALNPNKVPASEWRKWSDLGRHTFNTVFFELYRHRTMFAHPKARSVPMEHWRTTAWNAAWVAADAVREHEPKAKRPTKPLILVTPSMAAYNLKYPVTAVDREWSVSRSTWLVVTYRAISKTTTVCDKESDAVAEVNRLKALHGL